MKHIDKILQTLIINGTLAEQPGLYYGKTGIAIFFFHYARQTGSALFQQYAMDLIEALLKQITTKTETRYDIGIAGIGAGFEYFLQNGFIEAEDNDFFEEFDDRIYRATLYETYTDLSLAVGLTGLGSYFICRLRGNAHEDSKLHKALTHIAHEISKKIKLNKVSENEQPDVYRFFHDLTTLPGYAEKYANSLQQCKAWNCIKKPDIHKLFPYMNALQRLYAFQYYFNMDLSDEIGKEWKAWIESDNNSLINMGLLNGWAAEGMLYMTYYNNLDASWIKLL